MSSDLRHDLRQTKPFPSPETEAALSVLRTAALLGSAVAETLKPHGLTPTQYNVLRILRGAGDGGLCRHEVGDRLVREATASCVKRPPLGPRPRPSFVVVDAEAE